MYIIFQLSYQQPSFKICVVFRVLNFFRIPL
nr:MAG TPA: hypothetical protein [Caudoviricetes sp.]